MKNITKMIAVSVVLLCSTPMGYAKCHGKKVNDCSTFSDTFHDRSKDCTGAYKAGNLWGGYPCKWLSFDKSHKKDVGGTCYWDSSC